MDENNDNGSGSTQLADPRPQLDTPLRVSVNKISKFFISYINL